MKNKACTRILCLLLFAAGVHAQDAPPAPRTRLRKTPERWNIFWQATSIGQAHDNFHAPYTGPESLNRSRRGRSLADHHFVHGLPAGGLHRAVFRSGNRGRQGLQQRRRTGQRLQRRAAARGQRDPEAVHRAAVHRAGFRFRRRKGSSRIRRKISWAGRGR